MIAQEGLDLGAAGSSENLPGRFAGLFLHEWCVVAVALVVASLPAVMPAMVAAMASQPGIGTEGAGYLVSVNMAGIFCGTLLCTLFHDRASAKRLIIAGLLVMMLGNLATIAVMSMPALLATRMLSGLGEGFAAGVCFSLLAGSARPASTFAYYTAGQAVVGAIGMGTLPWLVAAFDWRAFYVAMTVIAVPALFLAGIATRGISGRIERLPKGRISGSGWTSLAIIFVYFTGMALVWAFLQRIGELNGLPLPVTSAALASSALAGLAGSLAVAFGGERLSDRIASIIGIALVASSAAGLFVGSTAAFFFGAWALNFAWGFQYPFLFRMLARTDAGKGAAVTPMATGTALSVGPALGGMILANVGSGAACAAFLLMTLGALFACLLRSGSASIPPMEQQV